MRKRLAMLCLLAAILPLQGFGGGVGRAVARGATRSLFRSAPRAASRGASKAATARVSQLLRRDRLHHGAFKPLSSARTVHRYTTLPRARVEVRRGIPPNRHMTALARRGRPMSAAHAKKVYGLPQRPDVRETIRLNRGVSVQHSRVLRGAPGRGELTSPRRVPRWAIQHLREKQVIIGELIAIALAR